MRSLPSRNIVKDAEERDVQSYDFFAGFLLKKEEEVPEEFSSRQRKLAERGRHGKGKQKADRK